MILYIHLFVVLLFITINLMVFIPKIREKKLFGLLHTNPEKFLIKVNKYYRFTLDPIWKNCVSVIRLEGLYKCHRKDELLNEINIVNINKLTPEYLVKYCDDVLLFYLSGENDIANVMMKNFGSINNQKVLKSKLLKLINAASAFANGEYQEADMILSHLKSVYPDNYHITYIYYYLGMIYLNKGNKESSRESFEKSYLFRRKTIASEKSLELLNNLDLW